MYTYNIYIHNMACSESHRVAASKSDSVHERAYCSTMTQVNLAVWESRAIVNFQRLGYYHLTVWVEEYTRVEKVSLGEKICV